METSIPVFIASPGDVPYERRHSIEAINEVSAKLLNLFGFTLTPVAWEYFAPLAAKHSSTKFQDTINIRLSKCGIFIGVLYQRCGTEIDTRRKYTGTESEFRHAIRHRQNIAILSYFRTITEGAKAYNKYQQGKLNELKRSLKGAGIPHQPYQHTAEFRQRIGLDLMETAVGIIADVERRERLREFFLLGIGQRRTEPSIMIGYPAIHKHQSAKISYNWRQRLLPNVVFEDFKTIQKLEGSMRMLGLSDYSSATLDHPDLAGCPGNRIWLCIPRNPLARRRLNELGNRKRFEFIHYKKQNAITWRRFNKSRRILVQSPLIQYLRVQRPSKHVPWKPGFGSVLCKDFAIISRFSTPEGEFDTRHGPYYHYFMAGIRGLGTWGVGWFVDRRVEELSRLCKTRGNNTKDLQALLEVTYEHQRIVKVKDVSEKPQSYFEREIELKYVRENVKRFRSD